MYHCMTENIFRATLYKYHPNITKIFIILVLKVEHIYLTIKVDLANVYVCLCYNKLRHTPDCLSLCMLGNYS